MKNILLTTALYCLLAGNGFADFYWIVDSGNWTVGTNWSTGFKPNGTQHVSLNRSGAVCTLNTDEGLIAGSNRLHIRNGLTLNIENGGRVGFGWSRIGYESSATVNMSGNGAFVLNNDDLYIGYGGGGNGMWTMSDTSSITVNAATTGGDNLYVAQDNCSGMLKLIGSGVTVHANEVLIGDAKNLNTNPIATLEFVMDVGGASKIVSDAKTGILKGTFGANAAARLIISAPGVTLGSSDIVLIECLASAAIDGKGVFDTINGGPAAEGTEIKLGGNVYFLTYKYAVDGVALNDVALVYVRSVIRYIAKTPTPLDSSFLTVSPTTLSWTNPDPNEPGNSITCTVYFGTDPNRPQMNSVTLAPNASSVAINAMNFPTFGTQPLTNNEDFYWVVDCVDASPGVNPADGQGLFWKFTTDLNEAPTVDAGANQVVWLGKSGTAGQEVINLDGTTSDDGLPNPPAAYTVKWTQVSGPAVTISPDNINDTSVTITIAGVYVFQLTADDTKKQASDTVQVIVGNNSCHASYLNGTNYNSKDFNTDCNVDLADLEEFVDAWLACTNTQEGCL